MLKADLHIHTKEDPHESIKYDAKDLIDYVAKQEFDIISITNHDVVTYNKKLADYAKSKGILLIHGIERRIKGKEVLLYNFTKKEIKKIKTFEDLRRLKSKNKLIIAPHPFFFKKQCLKKELIKNIDLFDAIEYSFFYIKLINFNKKSLKIARRHNKAVIGTSDAHHFWQIGYTFSLIDSKKNIKDVFSAIRNRKIILKTKPLPLNKFFDAGIGSLLTCFRKY